MLQNTRPEAMETEVFAHGHLPLSFSARCFTAQADNVGKDECEQRCIGDPEGRALFTQEHERLFTINGIQLQYGVHVSNGHRYCTHIPATYGHKVGHTGISCRVKWEIHLPGRIRPTRL